jgi:glycosyltransferase involved in cell wall biosynthesis
MLPRQLEHLDRLLSPSRFTRQKHLDAGIQRRIDVLPYFLPSPKMVEPEGRSPHERPYFLFVGRLVKIKGLQTLFPVMQKYPAADLLVAGEGEFEAELRRQADGIANIKFLGPQPYAQLQNYYRHAIALIMPSICYEVFGIVLIEAFAMKTPVIVRELGGMSEVVEDSSGGFVYRHDAELLQAMARLQADPPLRQSLGEQGHAAYQRLWNEDAHLARYFEIIADIRERRRG